MDLGTEVITKLTIWKSAVISAVCNVGNTTTCCLRKVFKVCGTVLPELLTVLHKEIKASRRTKEIMIRAVSDIVKRWVSFDI